MCVQVDVDVQEGGRGVLVDFERVDAPVGLFEGCGVVLDVRVAGACLRGAGVRWPDGAGPVAAEGYVEDLCIELGCGFGRIDVFTGTYDLQILEMGVDITGSGEPGTWEAPAQRVRLAVPDIGRNAGVGEEPDVDGIACPFGGVDAAAGLVEAVAVGRAAVAFDGAACVGRLAWCLDVAVGCVEGA